MAEPQLTTRRSDSPCLFSSSSGPFNAAPVVGLRHRCGRSVTEPLKPDRRSLFPLSASVATSRVTVTIESSRAPKFRMTTSAASGKLTSPAECL